MGPCPYCGEKIGAEARLCRHCDRTVLYSVFLTASLNDKQKHEFLRLWKNEDLLSSKHTAFGGYSEARKLLDKIPVLLAWDLNYYSASSLSQKFESFAAEPRLQGGLPSSFTPEAQAPKTQSFWMNAINLGIAAGLLLAASVLLWNKFTPQTTSLLNDPLPKPQVNLDVAPSLTIPPIEIVSAPQTTSQDSEDPHQTTFTKGAIEYALGATVFISGEKTLGSGFIVSSDGYIVSNKHVTGDMSRPIVTLQNGRRYEAEKIKEDPRYDLALIKIDAQDLNFLKLGDASSLYPGEPIITVGNPGGLAFTITRGIVSFNGRIVQGVPHIQTDAAINKGNSGGPMINSKMEVVGVNTLTSIGEQGISFSLPINLACDRDGITAGLRTDPSECSPYQSPQTTAESASVRGPQSSNAEKYSLEAQELKSSLQAKELELSQQMSALNSRLKEIQAQAAQDPNNQSLIERLNQEIQGIQASAKSLQKAQIEYRLNYMNGIVDLLERQMNDPDYFHVRNQVESQLNEVRNSREQLKNSLN